MLFWIYELLWSYWLEVVVVDGRNVEVAVDAFGNAGHFGVVVPVELLSWGYYHEEEGEIFLSFDGEGDDAGGCFD